MHPSIEEDISQFNIVCIVIFQFHASRIAMMESLGEFWWNFFNQIVPNAHVQSANVVTVSASSIA